MRCWTGRISGLRLLPMTAATVESAPQIRRGQHRNKALAAWRRARSVELAVGGQTYDEIAREVGYANRGTAYRVVQQALSQRVEEGVDELRRLEQDRLDALQAGVWERALAGDVAAVRTALRILESRCRLLGLHVDDQPRPPGRRAIRGGGQGDSSTGIGGELHLHAAPPSLQTAAPSYRRVGHEV